ncbi:hypothetical protein LTR53_000464 [Teratosphaeriaceae sp. CCFEE 6253]|nr:hypothetical protein LTR53_000464 [Teratosphaeriaceae sp. CCFEE 6253]
MARLSKIHSFAIHDDAGIPTPDSDPLDPFEASPDPLRDDGKGEPDLDGWLPDEPSNLQCLDEEEQERHVLAEEEDEDEPYRRASAIARTSVSSVPDSIWQDDKPYVPPLIRPSFMRPESVRRMQMRSPPPYRNSPRQSVLRHNSGRSRTGTPRSAQARGSPRPKLGRQGSGVTEDGSILSEHEFPLVLLHATILPIVLPWCTDAVRDLLPDGVRADLHLLQSKVTETVLARGLLIPHPRDEFEMLEARILEALELQEERVTKCGHFRATSRGSSSSTGSEGCDSGLGSSVDGSLADMDICSTCSRPIQSSKSGVSVGGRKWNIKVYAANGLMRAPAWAAAWQDMERVDVEILPGIEEGVRKQLHERDEHYAAVEADRAHRERRDQDLRELAEGRAYQRASRAMPMEVSPHQLLELDRRELDRKQGASEPTTSSSPGAALSANDFPQVYAASQVPLSVLLKNYIFLLAQDRRNMAVFFLALLTLWFAISKPARIATEVLSSSAQDQALASYENAPVLPDLLGAVVAGVGGATEFIESVAGEASEFER